MGIPIFKCILTVYTWLAVGILLFFLGRIAYFYEKTAGQKTHYLFLIAPASLLAAGAVWYLVRGGEFTGEPVGDLLLCSGGALLAMYGSRLHTFMTGARR